MPSLNERLNNWLQRYYLFVTLLVVGLIVVGSLNWLLLPEYERLVATGSGEYEDLNSTITLHEQYLADLHMMESNYNQMDQRVMRILDSIVPEQYASGPVFASIEQLFVGSKFTVQSINVSADTTANPDDAATTTSEEIFQPIAVSVNLIGSADASYTNFKALLERIERNPQIMNINSMSYAPGSNAFTFVLHTYQRGTLTTSNNNGTTQP